MNDKLNEVKDALDSLFFFEDKAPVVQGVLNGVEHTFDEQDFSYLSIYSQIRRYADLDSMQCHVLASCLYESSIYKENGLPVSEYFQKYVHNAPDFPCEYYPENTDWNEEPYYGEDCLSKLP